MTPTVSTERFDLMNIETRQRQIIEEFSRFANWEERYKRLIEKGKALPELPQALKVSEALVKGCQSQVWLHASMENGKIIFQADSDALLVRGLVALLLDVFSGSTPQDILDSKVTFIEEIGLGAHLTPSRANGLFSMVKQIKFFALAFQMKPQ